MNKGEIWTIAGGKNYAAKPRPAVILQNEGFDYIHSITLCPFTTNTTEAPLFRLWIAATEKNGLRAPSNLMVDKINTLPKTKLGARIGHLEDADILRLNQAILLFLGLAAPPRRRSA